MRRYFAYLEIQFKGIKAHVGINGNEKADFLAKQGAQKAHSEGFKITGDDVINWRNRITKSKWSREFNWQNNKGLYYKSICSPAGNVPWFKFNNLGRFFVKTICRLRSNHALCPEYLHKIGLRDTSICDCRLVGSSHHIILECNLVNADSRVKLFKNLNTIMLGPFNLKGLLALNDIRIYKFIVDFCLFNDICF